MYPRGSRSDLNSPLAGEELFIKTCITYKIKVQNTLAL